MRPFVRLERASHKPKSMIVDVWLGFGESTIPRSKRAICCTLASVGPEPLSAAPLPVRMPSALDTISYRLPVARLLEPVQPSRLPGSGLKRRHSSDHTVPDKNTRT